jgi:hypothetical protein
LFVTDEMPDLARRVDTDEDWQPEIDAATLWCQPKVRKYLSQLEWSRVRPGWR